MGHGRFIIRQVQNVVRMVEIVGTAVGVQGLFNVILGQRQ